MVRTITALALIGAAVTGCATAPLPAGPSAAVPTAYTLAAGDRLQVTTYGFPTMSGEAVVGADDAVSLPLIGSVPAGGLTSTELEKRVASVLVSRDLVKSPRVSIQVTLYRPFFVLGEVNQPGKYDFTNGLTVLQAIATARGVTYRGNMKSVFIRREKASVETPVLVTASAPVYPGDTVRVGERHF